ncbi:MAG: hypothetical protein H8E64_07415 [Candidatus Marinimicrobia bacterium]|nr:hypothetical protein [Candidatus Neomarinimicrobiota bacterium]
MRKITKLIMAGSLVVASVMAQPLDFSGYARTYLGVLTNDSLDYAINQNTFNLNIEKKMGNVGFLANATMYQYPNSDLNFDLSELYMDIFFDNMDLRLGRQMIIWGKADGVFITDIISPKDLGEFLLRDFDEIRTGVTSLKADYYLGNNTLEFVWIPTFTSTLMPDESSIWSRTPSFDLPVTIDYSQKEVRGKLENSEAFLKFSGMSSLIDYELMAGTMWDDDPTMHISPVMEEGNPQPLGLTLTPKHHRLNLFGGSFSTEIKGFVVRGEGAYYTGKQFSALNPMNNMAIDLLEKDYLHYLLGTDFNIGETRLSTQFIQRAILDYDDTIVQDEMDNMMTFLVNRTFLRETLTLQLFSYVGLNFEDALIRPTIAYDIADGFEILAGANIFYRNDDTDPPSIQEMFGYYDENDMVYLKLKYSF